MAKFNDANKDEWYKKSWIVLKSYSLLINATKIWTLFYLLASIVYFVYAWEPIIKCVFLFEI